MKWVGLELWTFHLKTENVTFVLLTLDYIAQIFISYILLLFLDDIIYTISYNVFENALNIY